MRKPKGQRRSTKRSTRPAKRRGCQHRLPFLNHWGGRRAGAGPRPKGERAGVSHRQREQFVRESPLHVTLRIREGLNSLREHRAFQRIEESIEASNAKPWIRVVEYAVLSNHIHLVVEARDTVQLSTGMKGLNVRLARALNRLWGRKGKVFGDRYHSERLTSPRQVRNALSYVLNNARKHGLRLKGIDPFSSGRSFSGWIRSAGKALSVRAEASGAKTWLLRSGWKRHGLIDPRSAPAPPSP